jgi:hypothetical protein
MERTDIFTATTRYEKPENRFTASLVYLLGYLWRTSDGNAIQRKALCEFLTKLCEIDFYSAEYLDFEMQKGEKTEQDGKRVLILPDFQIKSENLLVWVEVKDDAPLSQKLSEYSTQLKRKAKKRTCRLVLLRNRYISPNERQGASCDVRWSRLYALLRDLQKGFATSEISKYLLEEFGKFLEGKGVSAVERVDRNLIVRRNKFLQDNRESGS